MADRKKKKEKKSMINQRFTIIRRTATVSLRAKVYENMSVLFVASHYYSMTSRCIFTGQRPVSVQPLLPFARIATRVISWFGSILFLLFSIPRRRRLHDVLKRLPHCERVITHCADWHHSRSLAFCTLLVITLV